MNLTNKRSIIHQFGKLTDVIQIETCPLPACGPNDILIKMEYAPINPSDLVTISGAYRGRTKLPFIPGFEGVGVIYKVGDSVSNFKIGERVVPIRQSGTWQEFQLAQAENCFKINDQLSPTQAAMSYINPMTAIKMVEEVACIDSANTVIVNAANSEIGHIIIQLSLKAGAQVTALARSDCSMSELNRTFGKTIRIQEEKEFTESQITSSFDVMFDAIGGPKAEELAMSLKNGGMIVHYGLLSGSPISPNLNKQRPDINLKLYWLRNWVHTAPYYEIQNMFERTADLILGETIVARVFKTLSLSELAMAERLLHDPQRSGKVLLEF